MSADGDTTTEPADWVTLTTASPMASPAVAATAVVPLPTADTSPTESTVAMVVSALDQETPTPSITRPIWSRTSAASCAVCPSAASATVSGVTATAVGTGATTVSAARPVTPAAVAVTSASPAPTPVTRPPSSTTATSVSLDAHSKSVPTTGCALASVASAASRSVSPATSVSAAGVSAMVLTSWATVTVALPDTEPAVAVIVAVPSPTAVTSPDALTVPTMVLLLAQLTVAPAIAWPFWSRTSARSCTVSPRAVSSAVAGVTITVVGRGGSGGGAGGSVEPSPQAAAQATVAIADVKTMKSRLRLFLPLARKVLTKRGRFNVSSFQRLPKAGERTPRVDRRSRDA